MAEWLTRFLVGYTGTWSVRHLFLPRARAMSDVTRILSSIDQGDPKAAEQLLPLIYEELRKLAAAHLA